jgi:hypothetical protein
MLLPWVETALLLGGAVVFIVGLVLLVVASRGRRGRHGAPLNRALAGLFRDPFAWVGLSCICFATFTLLMAASLYVNSLGFAALGSDLSLLSVMAEVGSIITVILSWGRYGNRWPERMHRQPPHDA